ncbi:MAG: MBL fold metallo-hydrolase [Planctomycetes bacterium]|nr:MBL fold metallo-hydrolase [Planctomycetota bacterium]
MKTGRGLIDEINGTETAPGCGAAWWLGQHGFVFKLGHAVCYIDAFLSPHPERLIPPLLRPEEITNADLICGSHDHTDHIDRETWPAIAEASPKARFAVPLLLREQIIAELRLAPERVVGMDEGLLAEVEGLCLSAVPAAHEFLDTDTETGLHPYIGFVLNGNGVCVYHSGDTCLYEGLPALLRQWDFDAAFLPINGRDAERLARKCIGNLTFQEAVDLAGAIHADLSVPTHFDMFKGNSENPAKFLDYMRVKYPQRHAILPRHGERFFFGQDRGTSAE